METGIPEIISKINCLASLISQLLSEKSITNNHCLRENIRKVIKRIIVNDYLSLLDYDFSFLVKFYSNLY